MTTCPAPDQLEQLLGDLLDQTEERALGVHVEACPACQQALEALTRGAAMGVADSGALGLTVRGWRNDQAFLQALKNDPPPAAPAGSVEPAPRRHARPQLPGYVILGE